MPTYEIHLNNNQLSSLPPEIGQIRCLRYLYLDNNQLRSLPPEIGELSCLWHLSLDNNQLSNVPPEIGQLNSLITFHLGNNQFNNLPVEMGQLSGLRYLYLDNNQLSNLPPEIGQLTDLQELYLNGNQLSGLPSEIGELTHLLKIDWGTNQLSNLPLEISRQIEANNIAREQEIEQRIENARVRREEELAAERKWRNQQIMPALVWLIIASFTGWGKYKLAQGRGCLISLVGIPIGAIGIYYVYMATMACYRCLTYGLELIICPPIGAIIGYIIFLMIPIKHKKEQVGLREEFSEYEIILKRKEKPKRH